MSSELKIVSVGQDGTSHVIINEPDGVIVDKIISGPPTHEPDEKTPQDYGLMAGLTHHYRKSHSRH